nr:chondroitinase-B domain-containing protein [Oceanipulchritudo coccoides]
MGADYVVSSEADFSALPTTLQAGDTVRIQAGTYTDIQRTLKGTGTAGSPISVYAEPLGGAVFEGLTRFTLDGSHIILAGLVFDGNGGPVSSNGVVQLAKASDSCRVTNCQFKDFNAGPASSYWLFAYGFNHRIDHCSFEGKTTENVTVNFKPDSSEGGASVTRNHRFDHNYMGPRTVIGTNGYEGIRISDSSRQVYRMEVTVEHNLFFQTIKNLSADEMEVISNKSAGNIFRYNTFMDNDGQLTLRHGDECIVEGNFFFGSGTGRDSGVRVIGQDHVVRNNYFEGIQGTGLRSTVVVMAGDNDWPASDDSNGYEAADRAVIANNTFVDCKRPINIGEDKSDGVVPDDVRILNNVVQNSGISGIVFDLQYATSLMEFGGNLVYDIGGNYGTTGLSGVTYGVFPDLVPDVGLGYSIPSGTSPCLDSGLVDPLIFNDIRGLPRTDGNPDIGAYEVGAAGTPIGAPLARAEVGPAYYGGPSGSYSPPGSIPEILTASFPEAPLNGAYSVSVVSIGGDAPLSYSVSVGSLPVGLTLDSVSGTISGTATAPGVFPFSLRVSDNDGDFSDKPFSITVQTQETLIVDETFADEERATQDLSNNSMAWYSSSGTSNVIDPSAGVPELTQLTGNSGRGLLAFFADSGSPVSLAAGETLLIRFEIRFFAGTTVLVFDGTENDFRMGTWDSHGNRDTTMMDNFKGTSTSSPNPDFVDYTGYMFSGGLDSARNISLRKKIVPSDPILIGSTSVYTSLGSTSNSEHTTISDGVIYTGSLSLANTGSDLTLTYSLDQGSINYALLTRTDSTSPNLTFDTVAFHLNSRVADGFTLDRVEVHKLSSVNLSQELISGEILSGGDMKVVVPSQSGARYHLQVSTDLSSTSWGTVSSLDGTGADLEFTTSGPTSPGEKLFYRVVAIVNP